MCTLQKKLNGVSSWKSKQSATLSKLFCIGFSTPETKLLTLFCCYSSMLLVLLAYATMNFHIFDSTVEMLETYFRCSIAGENPECDVYKEELADSYQLPYYFAFLAYIMITAINLGNLIYALHVHNIKSMIKRVCASRHC